MGVSYPTLNTSAALARIGKTQMHATRCRGYLGGDAVVELHAVIVWLGNLVIVAKERGTLLVA